MYYLTEIHNTQLVDFFFIAMPVSIRRANGSVCSFKKVSTSPVKGNKDGVLRKSACV